LVTAASAGWPAQRPRRSVRSFAFALCLVRPCEFRDFFEACLCEACLWRFEWPEFA